MGFSSSFLPIKYSSCPLFSYFVFVIESVNKSLFLPTDLPPFQALVLRSIIAQGVSDLPCLFLLFS